MSPGVRISKESYFTAFTMLTGVYHEWVRWCEQGNEGFVARRRAGATATPPTAMTFDDVIDSSRVQCSCHCSVSIFRD
jgi:hypothetical protein